MEVEIWSDIVCPWCYIGKRRFEAALKRFDHADEVRVIWRSFELDPSSEPGPASGNTERLAAKMGRPVEAVLEMQQHVTELAAGEGLEYHLDKAPADNSFDGHRLIHLAAEHGLADQMKERLLRAHFTEGRLISDRDELVELATEVGLDAGEVRAMLSSDRFAQAVREDEQTAREFGLSGVPTFVVDRAIAVSGAQPPEVLLQLLEQGYAHRQTLPV